MKSLKVYSSQNDADKALNEIYKNKNQFYTKYVDSIRYGIEHNIVNIRIFEIVLENGEEFDVSCHRNNWNEALKECMDYFISIEDYEKCSEIKTMIELE